MHKLRTWQLFAICVSIWGTTWYAITWQLGPTAPEVGVALRFVLAGGLVLGMAAAGGQRLRFGLADHLHFVLQGALMYGVAYLCVYHAEKHLVSGLVAVGYSASPLVGALGARLLFGVPLTRRFLLGGLVGLTGVALIFWPEIGKAGADGRDTVAGVIYTVAAVLLSAAGALAASRNRHLGLPFWPSLGWGMVYGGIACALVAAVQGQSFTLPATVAWWGSLLYLALLGSVLAFASYLTLQERIGVGPAGTIGVMVPLLALGVSMLFEGYRPGIVTALGALLAIGGNALMLTPGAPVRRVAAAAE
jgi:drug/metabolite transporter (DMT)-like permease